MWENVVIDASMGAQCGGLCFCPVELDDDGEITAVLTGMNFIGSPPPGSKVIAIVHDDGQAACEAFYNENRPLIDPFFPCDRDGNPEGGDGTAPCEA